jgi:hypothetical protein
MSATDDDECPLSELPASMCGLPCHRGGELVDPPETVGQPFSAMFPGVCPSCERPIEVGHRIARLADPDGGYVHVPRCPR